MTAKHHIPKILRSEWERMVLDYYHPTHPFCAISGSIRDLENGQVERTRHYYVGASREDCRHVSSWRGVDKVGGEAYFFE